MKRLILLAALGVGLATAQPAGFRHHGSFKHMVHSGDLSAKVQLAALEASPGVWGVGALAGLKGEVIQIDGKLLVSPGTDPQGNVRPAAEPDAAVLWASAKVAAWTPVVVPTDMDQAQTEDFVRAQAKGRQIDLDQPFAFRITGSYSHLIWHVVTGGKPAGAAAHGEQGHGGHGGHANQQAGMKVFRSPQAEGQLVGIYSGARLEGVVSHPGERFHIHFVDAALKVSGHVDQYRVKSGSTLWLAQP